MMIFYHFTCDHAAAKIRLDGFIRPGSDFGVDLPQSMFSWFTDLDVAPRAALGMEDAVLDCDRMGNRFTVDSPDVLPWRLVRRSLPRYFVDALEGIEGTMPMHWWVAAVPIEVQP